MNDESKVLSDDQLDVFTELFNIGVGRAASLLSDMLEQSVLLRVPRVRLVKPAEASEALGQHEALAIMEMGFDGGLSGRVCLTFPKSGANDIVSTLTGEVSEDEDFDSLRAATLSEVGNIMLNSVLGTLANSVASRLDYSVPEYRAGSGDDVVAAFVAAEGELLLADVRFIVAELSVEGDVVLAVHSPSLPELVRQVQEN